MKSDLPKPLHKIAHKPMLGYVIDTYRQAGATEIVVVIGPDDTLTPKLYPDMHFAVQKQQRGTGDAAMSGLQALNKPVDKIIVALGDQPFVSAETVQHTIAANHAVTVVAMQPDDPARYGRLITDSNDHLLRITEYKDATDAERAINLCNAYPIALDGKQAKNIMEKIQPNNAANEYYFTDCVSIANEMGLRCGYFIAPVTESVAANTRAELAVLENIVQDRLRQSAMDNGVTLQDPQSVYFSSDTQIERDVIVEPNVFFGSGVSVGSGTLIRSFSHIEGATIGPDCEIGPFARIGINSHFGPRVRIGNFVETKKVQLGERATAKHLSYIGDATLGAHVNIGAGTIFCNYDGFTKHHTIVGDHTLIGSNNSLVAPVTIGENAITGAGSVITKNVSAGDLALERSQQTNKTGWASAFRAKFTKHK